jgi:hypothetical protein
MKDKIMERLEEKMETSQKDKKAMMNLSWKNYGHNGS